MKKNGQHPQRHGQEPAQGYPRYPDWPEMPHADWPRSRFYRWNDSEHAAVNPWWEDCCTGDENPCVCVTSGDVELWNSYSGLSGLTAFDASALSAAFDTLKGMDDYSAVRNTYYMTSANSGMWNSAGYVPNIYTNISALYDYLNDKVDYSAFSAFHVWTDSEKLAHEAGIYGDFSGTIVGNGTYERPLRVSKELAKTMFNVESATSGFTVGLPNNDTIDRIYDDLSAIIRQVTENQGNIDQNEQNIEWIMNHMKDIVMPDRWVHRKVSLAESTNSADCFFYWDEENEAYK